LRQSDQIAMAIKIVAAAKHILYGRIRLSGLLRLYVLRYLVLVTGTMSHQVPSEMAEMVMLANTSLSMASVMLSDRLGSYLLKSEPRTNRSV